MRIPSTLLAATAALVISATVLPVAQVSAARVPASKNQVLLTFDYHESLRAGTWVRDASGHHHRGRVHVEAGGRLRPDSGIKGRSADFPNRCRGCGRAIIEIPDHRGLDPLRRDFTFGAAVRVTKPQVVTGSNLLQKGYFNQAGGQWKLQLGAGGIPTCVVFGGLGRVKVVSSRGVANGTWHRLSCTRRSTGVTLRIDGLVRGRVAGATGHVANIAPIRVGGKKVTARNKQFHGDIDSVFLRFLT